MQSIDLASLGQKAKAAARSLVLAKTAEKDLALRLGAEMLEAQAEQILEANSFDLARAAEAGEPASVTDRLRLDRGRLAAMAAGLRAVAALADPVGEVIDGWVRPNGLRVQKVRAPLGVVGVIYENRPNVTSDAAGLCLKSSNAALLRGSSGALNSNRAIAGALRDGYAKAGIDPDVLVLVEATDRESARSFMRLEGLIDCLVPRGGPSLIEAVRRESSVPYVIDGDGVCHVYVDESADLEMAKAIVVNAKTSRPSVCNAAECLLVHSEVAHSFLGELAPLMPQVELRADPKALAILGSSRAVPASDDDWGREFLDLVMAVKVVDSLEEALDHIERYGSGHTEAIVTTDLRNAQRFQAQVDAAAVVVNASTRFTDGEQFGFGAEIGISTQKLHARGPMGLRELTTYKYLISGEGQVRI